MLHHLNIWKQQWLGGGVGVCGSQFESHNFLEMGDAVVLWQPHGGMHGKDNNYFILTFKLLLTLLRRQLAFI